MNKNESKELIGIQFLRGLAAILVVLAHTTGMARFPKYFNVNILSGYFNLGTVGVELFFVISGFIISFITLQQESLHATTNIKAFFVKRFIRIIPFMWVCVIGFAVFRFLGRGYLPWLSYVRSLILFPIGEMEPRQIWTLRHELLFYIMFSVLILRSKQQWGWLILWFLSPVVWSVLEEYLLFSSVLFELGEFVFSRHNILFGMGCAIGVLYKKGYLYFKVNTSSAYLLTIISVIPLLLVSQGVHGVLKLSQLGQEVIIGATCFVIVVLGVIIVSMKEGPFSRLGRILGDASYSIYLTHGVVIAALLGWWSKIQPSANSIVVLIVITVACCTVGIAVHLLVEKPLIRLIQRKINGEQIVV